MRHAHHVVIIAGMALLLLASGALAGARQASGTMRIMVAQFAALTPDAGKWIAKAVQRDLAAELSQLPGVAVTSVDRSFGSTEEATAAAGKYEADAVLTGSYQAMDGQLRFNGQLIDVRTQETMGWVHAQGELRDLFAMEDQLSRQLKDLLRVAKPSTSQPASSVTQSNDSGPVRKGEYGPYGAYGMYNGSSLQRAIEGGGLGVPAAPKAEGESDSSYWYRYGTPYYPWYGWYPRYYYPGYYYWPQVYHPRFTPSSNPPPANTQGYVPMTQGYVPMTLRP